MGANTSIDSIDERILYYLAREARHTSAPDIAERVDVSAPTVRNRIRKLESAGVIRGYHADIDYERAGGRLTNRYVCTTGNRDREEMAQRILEIEGVINVREFLTGKGDLAVKVVGEDTERLTQIAQRISALGVDIDDEGLFYREYFRPFAPFGPTDEAADVTPVIGVGGPAGSADAVEVLVREGAPIVGRSLEEANEADLIPSDVLVVRINRNDEGVTPTGETRIQAGDFVTLQSRSGVSEETLAAFVGSERALS